MDDVAILIQGPTKDYHFEPGGYHHKSRENLANRNIFPDTVYNRMISFYNNFSNVYWCTWHDEPKERLIDIDKSNITLILTDKPSESGRQNVNLQIKSTSDGIRFITSHNKKIKFIFKIRSDLFIYKLQNIVTILKSLDITKPSVLFYRTDYNFVNDHCMFGELELMHKFWNRGVLRGAHDFPEKEILKSYCMEYNIDIPKTFDDHKLLFNFMSKYILDLGIDVDWIKYNTLNLIKHHMTIEKNITF